LDLRRSKTGRGENCIMMNFTACIFHRIFVRMIKSRRMRWAGHVALMGEGRGVDRVLVGRPECKRPLVGPRRRVPAAVTRG
jgi:hypothetical protein